MNDYMTSQLNASRQAALAARAERDRLIQEARAARKATRQAPTDERPVRRLGGLYRPFRRSVPATA